MWHGYFGFENLNMNTTQRAELIAVLKTMGLYPNHKQPSHRNHWRKRPDDEVMIFEALFSEAKLTIAQWKDRLASIFGVSAGSIGHSASTQNFSGDGTETDLVIFSHSGTNYLRVALFGGVACAYQQSGDEVRAYLKLYEDDWE